MRSCVALVDLEHRRPCILLQLVQLDQLVLMYTASRHQHALTVSSATIYGQFRVVSKRQQFLLSREETVAAPLCWCMRLHRTTAERVNSTVSDARVVVAILQSFVLFTSWAANGHALSQIPSTGTIFTGSAIQICKTFPNKTRSSAIAEGSRDASCQLKSCQLPRNSAETTCTTSPETEQIEVMKLEG